MPYYADMFKPGEVLLIHLNEQPAFFARVESIKPDRKKGWWQMTMLLLVLPMQKITWILDNDQLHGADFTMNKNPVRIERVEAPKEDIPQENKVKENKEEQKGTGRIVSLFGDE